MVDPMGEITVGEGEKSLNHGDEWNGRYRPEYDVKLLHVVCLSRISSVSFTTILCGVWKNDRVEVFEAPGDLHDSELCRLHAQRE